MTRPISTKLTFVLLGIVIAIIVALTLWNSQSKETKNRSVKLEFHPVFESSPLVFNQLIYPVSSGEGLFKITDFRFFVSNIKLVSDSNTFAQSESYHLVRFDNSSNRFDIVIQGVDANQYQAIELSIGVDQDANRSLLSIGDLNPNSRMAWNWEVGYKFMLLEGILTTSNKRLPLVYHVGFSENLKTLTFSLSAHNDNNNSAQTTLVFNVDVSRIFGGETPFDMVQTPSVKFHKQDASRLADNYSHMLRLTTKKPVTNTAY